VDDASACGTLTLDVYVTDAVCGNTAPKYGKYDKVTTISTQVGNTAF
jgi:hypothetical protein